MGACCTGKETKSDIRNEELNWKIFKSQSHSEMRRISTPKIEIEVDNTLFGYNLSNLIQKFQIAFLFNKYRYIKYLSKGPPNNIRWTIWVSLALCQSGHDFISEEKYSELINKNCRNFENTFHEND